MRLFIVFVTFEKSPDLGVYYLLRKPAIQTSRVGVVCCFFCRAQWAMPSITWSMPFLWQRVTFHLGSGDVVAQGFLRSVSLWVQASAVRGKGGMDVAADTHMDHMWSFNDTAGQAWPLTARDTVRSRLWGSELRIVPLADSGGQVGESAKCAISALICTRDFLQKTIIYQLSPAQTAVASTMTPLVTLNELDQRRLTGLHSCSMEASQLTTCSNKPVCCAQPQL